MRRYWSFLLRSSSGDPGQGKLSANVLRLASEFNCGFNSVMPAADFNLDSAVRLEWEKLQRTDARSASAFYFRSVLPSVVKHHQQQAAPLPPCELLVSLMGLSPETTVLATAFVRPQRLMIIASRKADHYCEQCTDFLTEHKLIEPEAISARFVEPTDHDALYGALCAALATASGRRLVDLTGGKKIMSAVAGYAAWTLGLPVCYLESSAYNEQMRRPEPGSEQIFILEPPSPKMG